MHLPTIYAHWTNESVAFSIYVSINYIIFILVGTDQENVTHDDD